MPEGCWTIAASHQRAQPDLAFAPVVCIEFTLGDLDLHVRTLQATRGRMGGTNTQGPIGLDGLVYPGEGT